MDPVRTEEEEKFLRRQAFAKKLSAEKAAKKRNKIQQAHQAKLDAAKAINEPPIDWTPDPAAVARKAKKLQESVKASVATITTRTARRKFAIQDFKKKQK